MIAESFLLKKTVDATVITARQGCVKPEIVVEGNQCRFAGTDQDPMVIEILGRSRKYTFFRIKEGGIVVRMRNCEFLKLWRARDRSAEISVARFQHEGAVRRLKAAAA